MGPLGPNQIFFLLQGLKWTLALSAIGFVGGGVFGLMIALARTAAIKPLRHVSAAYISVFQGTPLLMQLFVVYYGVALLGINVDAWLAVAIAFTLHASAFLGEIWRGAIEAIPSGQSDAAKALGLHYPRRMKEIILPQAFRLSLPATVGFLVQLIKGTSLAAIVGFIELARAGQIVSNQTYKPLIVFAVVGAIYFVICWPLSIYGARLENRLAAATQ
jgi:polar amino acid transport system permease protein